MPVCCVSLPSKSPPSTLPSASGEIGWFWPVPIQELITSPMPPRWNCSARPAKPQ
jgi:hypothetical protein